MSVETDIQKPKPAQHLWRFRLVPTPADDAPASQRVAAALRHAESRGIGLVSVTVELDPSDCAPDEAARVKEFLKRALRDQSLRATWPPPDRADASPAAERAAAGQEEPLVGQPATGRHKPSAAEKQKSRTQLYGHGSARGHKPPPPGEPHEPLAPASTA